MKTSYGLVWTALEALHERVDVRLRYCTLHTHAHTQVTNPAELLRLYLTFDLVEAVTLLVFEYIDAVMGHGKEYFGMEVRH